MAGTNDVDIDSLMNEMTNEEERAAEGVEQADPEQEALEAQKRMLELRQRSLEVSEAASGAATSMSESAANKKQDAPQSVDDFVSATGDGKRGEVSASTIGRMLGLVTSAEFKLLESKMDLLSTRMNSVLVKMEKVLVMGAEAPTGADLERIDVQIAAVRTVLNDIKKSLEDGKAIAANRPSDKPTGGPILSNKD